MTARNKVPRRPHARRADPPSLAALRLEIHAAQRELAALVRDDLYPTDALRQLVYQDLPELYAELVRKEAG